MCIRYCLFDLLVFCVWFFCLGFLFFAVERQSSMLLIDDKESVSVYFPYKTVHAYMYIK